MYTHPYTRQTVYCTTSFRTLHIYCMCCIVSIQKRIFGLFLHTSQCIFLRQKMSDNHLMVILCPCSLLHIISNSQTIEFLCSCALALLHSCILAFLNYYIFRVLVFLSSCVLEFLSSRVLTLKQVAFCRISTSDVMMYNI